MNLWEFIFELAKSDKSILHHLFGIKIFNKTLGYGIINKIENNRVYVSYDNRPNCKYKYKECCNLFNNLIIEDLPIDFKEELKTKSSNLNDKFIAIIFKIDCGEPLTENEIDFIFDRTAFELLGKYFEKNIADDKWNILNAAKYYRKASLIDKAFRLTDFGNIQQSQFKHHNDFNKFMAAVLTSHGACWRDYGNLPNAEKCACDALKYNISFYPYNLLGAIYIEKGNFEEGENFFQKAESLGSEKKDEKDKITNYQRSFLKSIIKKSSKEEKRKIANYFYCKDPTKYAFLKSYLK
jgi:tetratricopeptide (TPR) repeat protein